MSRARFDVVAAVAVFPPLFGALEVGLALLARGVVDPRALVVGAGCMAPVGAFAGVVAAFALRTLGRPEAPRSRVALPDRLDALGELVAFALLLGGASVVASFAAGHPVGGVRTPRFAALLASSLGAAGLAGAVLVAPWSGAPLARVARRAGRSARLLVSSAVVATALVAALVARGAMAAIASSTWVASSGALALAAGIGLASGRVGASSRRGVLVTVAALALSPAVLPRSFGAARAACATVPGVVGASTRVVTALLDVDGDGAAGGSFGDDCAPFDGARGPFALEIPANGVDEDCSGIDLILPGSGVRRGEPRSKARPSTHRPNVVLVTTDALSFEHTSLGGYSVSTTPNLAAFAASATSFVNAFSTSSATCNAIPALHTGRLSLDSPGLLPPGYQSAAEKNGPIAPTLAETLRAAGYRTVGLAGARLFSRDAWPELARGFDALDTPGQEGAASDTEKRYLADRLTDLALDEVRRDDGRPLFLWVHYFDHHGPHGLPPGATPLGDGTSELARYDTELAWADRAWGRLFQGIAEAWRPDDAIVFFTADHGEAFDENHGLGRHETSLRSAEVHVPFVVQAAKGRGEVRRGLVSHLDVMATIVDLVTPSGGAVPTLDGETLAPALLEGREPVKNVVFSILWQPRLGPVGSPALRVASIRTADALYIDDREHQARALYGWPTDRLERRDLTVDQPGTAEWMRFVLEGELRREPGPEPSHAR